MDGYLKGIWELEFLGRKKGFIVPHSMLNLQQIIARTGEGNMGETLNKEKNKIKQAMCRELSDHIYLIDNKKSKLRALFA